ncbi:MAG: hypothetical protein ACQXXJ_04980 [Candidatus Bathyarchaeia archaeon]|jgi:cell division protein FtsB
MKTKSALAATTIVLFVSLVANAYLYTQQLIVANDDLRFRSQLSALESQLSTVQGQLRSLQDENANLQRENANLKHQLYYEREPFLVTMLGVSDVLYNPQYRGRSLTPRLYIQGEVWNAGDKVAYNCSLHVVLYQGSAVANETTIELGNIKPWTYVKVDRNIYYEGERLTNWTITPQWFAAPQFTQR